MKKRLISSIIAASMICGVGFNAVATPLTDSQKQEMEQSQQKFNDINAKIRDLEGKIDELTDKMEPLFYEIEKNKKEMEKTKEEIKQVQVEIEEAKVEIEKKQEVLGSRMRAAYKSEGQANYLEILLSSKGIGDFISKVQAISKIMTIDQNIIDDLTADKEKLDEKVSSLEAKNAELDKLNKETQTKLDEYNKMKSEQEGVIAKMKEEKSKIIGELAPLERQLIKDQVDVINNDSSSIQDLRNARQALIGIRKQLETTEVDKEAASAIEKAKDQISKKEAEQVTSSQSSNSNSGSSNSGSSSPNINRGEAPAPSGNVSSLVSYAHQFIGRPYVFGATGPDAFDCSGFTQYVFRKFGRNLSRTTYTQVNEGSYVSRDQLQPGDLVFSRGSAARPEHVGIYVGGGQVVHAARPGVGVVKGPIYNFVTARRVL